MISLSDSYEIVQYGRETHIWKEIFKVLKFPIILAIGIGK